MHKIEFKEAVRSVYSNRVVLADVERVRVERDASGRNTEAAAHQDAVSAARASRTENFYLVVVDQLSF